MAAVLALAGAALLLSPPASSRCPDNPAVSSLDVERFTGVWNIIKESDNLLAGTSKNVKCKHSVLKILDPGASYDIQAKIVTYNLTSRSYLETRFGLRKMKTTHEDGKFEITFSENRGYRFFVVDTDYDNYAVVWFCYSDFREGENVEYSAVLSRRKSLGERYLAKVDKLLPRGPYRTVDQTSCPEYRSTRP